MPRQKFPEPVVGALIFNRKGEMFLMKSHKWMGRYVMPGGHIELGEKIEDALRRETKEETGLDIHRLKFLGLQESIFDKGFWKKRHFIFLDFICKTVSSRVKLNHEAQKFIWIFPRESLKLKLGPYARTAIKKYLGKKS